MTIWRLVCFVVAAAPLYLVRFPVGAVPFTVFEVLILLLALITIARAIGSSFIRRAYKKKLARIPRELWIGALVLLVAASVAVWTAPNVAAALGIWKAYFVEALVLGLCVWLHAERDEDWFELAVAFSITTAAVAAYAVFQKFTGHGILNPFWRAVETRRVTGFFGYPNAVGLFLEIMVPFLMAAAWQARHWWARVWFGLCILLSLFAIIFAESSGTIAALGAAAVFTLVRFRRTRIATLVGVGFCALIIFLTPLRQPFADEFLLQGFSGQLRVQMWRETVVMLSERPFFGAGLSAYQTRVKPFHQNKRVEIYLYPHNLFLTLWSEIGLLGLAAFAWIFCLAFWWAVRTPTVWGFAVSALFVIWLVHGFVDVPYFKNDFAALYWVAVAAALHLRYTGQRS